MESTLFTALSSNEEASLSGGLFDTSVRIPITTVTQASGFTAGNATLANSSPINTGDFTTTLPPVIAPAPVPAPAPVARSPFGPGFPFF